MLKQLAVFVVGMAHCPVGEEAALVLAGRGLDEQRRDRAVDIRFADGGDALLVEQRVRRTGHDAQLVLKRVPALDGDGIAVVFRSQRLHADLERRHVFQLLIAYGDVHARAAVVDRLADAFALRLRTLDRLNKLGHGDGRELNVELLKQLALIAHG